MVKPLTNGCLHKRDPLVSGGGRAVVMAKVFIRLIALAKADSAVLAILDDLRISK
jgi:hypothetical protein